MPSGQKRSPTCDVGGHKTSLLGCWYWLRWPPLLSSRLDWVEEGVWRVVMIHPSSDVPVPLRNSRKSWRL
eukprot:7119447-Karenia_brevis.AAC.1